MFSKRIFCKNRPNTLCVFNRYLNLIGNDENCFPFKAFEKTCGGRSLEKNWDKSFQPSVGTKSFLVLRRVSVTRLGYFCKVLETNFCKKSSQNIWYLFGLFEKCHLLSKPINANFGYCWTKFGYFLFQHLVTPSN